MRNSIVGTIIGILLLFFSIIVLPLYFIGIVQWRTDVNNAQNAGRNFLDKVIDSSEVSKTTVEDLNLELAQCTVVFSYDVKYSKKVVNPDPSDPTGTITTWVPMDEIGDLRAGDIVTIEIKQENLNLMQRIANALLGTVFNKEDIRLSGMVR